jgi:uncharacterized protein (DUF1330 family)
MAGNEHEAPQGTAVGQPSFMITIARAFDAAKLKEITDRENAKLAGRGAAVIAQAKFAEAERLEGDLMDFDFRIVAFPTQPAATSYWNDPATVATRAERAKVAGVNTFLVAGVPRKA